MPHPAVQLLADKLRTGITHPGNQANNTPPTLIQLPGLRTAGLAPQLAEAVNNSTQALAEAVIHLLQTNGYITDPTPATPQLPGIPSVHCNKCGNILIGATNTTVNPTQFIRTIAAINPNCPHT